MSEVLVERAEDSHRDELSETLSLAFADDPVMNWFVRQDAGRDAARLRSIRSQTRYYLAEGHCYRASDGRGAAIWMTPGKPAAPPTRPTLSELRNLAQLTGWKRVWRPLSLMPLMARHHPEEPHYYLYMIGVRPEAAGGGLGGALLRAGLERSDAEGMPAYLENSNPRNLPFYERHGFEVMREARLPWGGPSLWFMWRRPMAPSATA